MKREAWIIIGALLGAITLCSLSALQKLLIGAPVVAEAFIVPLGFGLLTGAAAAFWQHKLLAFNRMRQLQDALDLVPMGIAKIDPGGRILFMNRNYKRLLGYEKDESAGETVFDLQPDQEQADSLREFIAKLRQVQPAPKPRAVRNVAKDGSLIDIELYWDYVRDDQGGITGFMLTSLDVTERKRIERRLVESEERFRKLLDDADMVPVQGYDENRRVIYWNKASENLYGYTQEEAMGNALEDLIIPDNLREYVISAVNDWVRKGIRIPAGEVELKHKDGSPVPVHSSHVMREDLSGRKEMYCIDVDLEEVKKAHTELYLAKEQAEAASMAKTDFLANMSHELRTPLNGIMGMHQLLLTTGLDSEQYEYVTLAIQSAKRLANLLGDILDLSRLETGKLEINPEPFDIRETMNLAEQLFRPSCEQRGIELVFNVDPDVPGTLIGDSARLLQILNNLIGNAVKFTEQGSVIVEAHALSSYDGGSYNILFSVTDTGIGIDESTYDSLFEGFTQADAGFKRKYQGAGLGLSIVKQFVTLMGGNISVVSRLGQGTAFHFRLPFRAAEGRADLSTARKEALAFPESSLKVLLAEDDYVNSYALEQLLTKHGYAVVLAENGRKALDVLLEEDFDVVLMDVQMPVMDGVETTRAIRAGEAGKDKAHIPVLALTAHALSGDEEKFLAAGMNGYLSKPLEEADLLAELGRLKNMRSKN